MHPDPLNPESQALNPRKRGRPRALDEIKRCEIIATINAGCGIETAARYAGVSPRTVLRELRRNKDFWDRYRKAELNSRIEPLDTMKRAVKESWRAAAWMLERKSPRDFAKVHPRMIDPLDLEASLGQIYDAVFRSIRDPRLRRKVARNIEKSLKTELHELTTERRSPRPPKPKKERPYYPDPFVDTDDDDNELSGATAPAGPGSAGGSRIAADSTEYSDSYSETPVVRGSPDPAQSTDRRSPFPDPEFPHSDTPILHGIQPASASEISSISIPNPTIPIPLFDLPAPNTLEDAPDIREHLSPTPNGVYPPRQEWTSPAVAGTPNSTTFCPETSDNIPATATPSPAAISVSPAIRETLSLAKCPAEKPS
jgi:hypothetical protein